MIKYYYMLAKESSTVYKTWNYCHRTVNSDEIAQLRFSKNAYFFKSFYKSLYS